MTDGAYTISASFTQAEPSGHPNAYGGGSDLSGPNQEYSYFVIEVATQPRSAVDTDGITGLGVTHLLNVHVADRYMNYYGAKELAGSFRTVRKNTIQSAEDIPEDQDGFTPAEGTKSIAQTLVHIALSPRLQLAIHAGERRTSFEGFDFPAFMKQLGDEEARDRTKAQVIELLRTEGEAWAGPGAR